MLWHQTGSRDLLQRKCSKMEGSVSTLPLMSMVCYYGGVNDMAKAKKGFTNKSNAVCVVAYDLQGQPISDKVAERVVKAVEEATKDERLAINYTRT